MLHLRPALIAASLGALSLAAGTAFAQPSAPAEARQGAPAANDVATAQARFAEGEAAFEKGDFVRAAGAFDAAYAADPNATSLFNAARSWERAGEAVRAANLYRRFLKTAPADTPFRERATASLADLAKRLGRIEIVGPGATSPSVDRVAALDTTVYVAPGTHLVEADIDGARVAEKVTLAADQTLTVVLEAPKPAPPAQPNPAPAPKPAPPSPRGVTPWILLPFSALTAGAGVTLIWSGIDTLVARDQYLTLSEDAKAIYYPDGKLAQDRTNVLIGVTAGLGLTTAALAVFAVNWGEGTLVGLGPSEARVVFRF